LSWEGCFGTNRTRDEEDEEKEDTEKTGDDEAQRHRDTEAMLDAAVTSSGPTKPGVAGPSP
jgi:hypothetical protein